MGAEIAEGSRGYRFRRDLSLRAVCLPACLPEMTRVSPPQLHRLDTAGLGWEGVGGGKGGGEGAQWVFILSITISLLPL